MWVGISVMSMTVMFREDVFYRAKRRAPFGAVGCVLFLLIYYLVPASLHPYIGILGGIVWDFLPVIWADDFYILWGLCT